MDYQQAATTSTDEILINLSSSPDGLSETQVQEKLAIYGKNCLPRQHATATEILLRQFESPFVYLLTAAVVISLFLKQYIDAILIVLFILINTVLGFWQEYRSEKAIRKLGNFIRHTTHVIRNGVVKTVATDSIVPGDVVILKAGDKVPADIRFVKARQITVDESILSGESVTVEKTHAIQSIKPVSVYKAKNIGFSGTLITSGEATAVVLATGTDTKKGQITKLTMKTKSKSPLQMTVNQLSQSIMKITFATLAVTFFLHLAIKGTTLDIGEFALFSVALAVGVVPEALPLVITLTLSQGALKLSKKKVVPKRLSAVEDLGSIEVLCTDKTGTITENILTVDDTTGGRKEDIIRYGALASSFLGEKQKEPNNAFDLALWKPLSTDQQNELKTITRLFEVPFDPHRRRNGVVISEENKKTLIVRGAAEALLPGCRWKFKHGKKNTLTSVEKKTYTEWIKQNGREGKRNLAVVIRPDYDKQYSSKDETRDLTLIGLVSFSDPLKKSAKKAIHDAKSLNVQIKIVTGDSKEVAGHIAYEVGLIDDPTKTISGEDFEKLSTPEQKHAVQEYHVFSRVTPEQKYHIVELLQKKFFVGFLGEGFNDTPALKLANVALAVQGASDIAKDASDIILLHKSLSVITEGIREGRKIFTNIVKYIKETLASNFGNFYALAIASLTIPFLPLLPLQILLVNLLSDLPMITIATDNVDPIEFKEPRRFNIHKILFVSTILGLVSTTFDFAFFGYFVKFGEHSLQTMWFTGSILTELVFLFSIRTNKPFYRAIRPSWSVLSFTLLAGIITVLIPFTQAGHTLFSFITPTKHFVIVTMLLTVAYFFSTEIVKLAYYRFQAQS